MVTIYPLPSVMLKGFVCVSSKDWVYLVSFNSCSGHKLCIIIFILHMRVLWVGRRPDQVNGRAGLWLKAHPSSEAFTTQFGCFGNKLLRRYVILHVWIIKYIFFLAKMSLETYWWAGYVIIKEIIRPLISFATKKVSPFTPHLYSFLIVPRSIISYFSELERGMVAGRLMARWKLNN